MSGRILPTMPKEGLGSSAEIQTIDVGTLRESLQVEAPSEVKTASVVDVPEEVTVETPERVRKYASLEAPMCEECGVQHPCTHDLLAAIQEGDMEKVASLKEIRKARRASIVTAGDEMVSEVEETEAVLETEEAVVAETEAEEDEEVVEAEEEDEEAVEASEECDCADDGCKPGCKCTCGCAEKWASASFKSTASLDEGKKAAFTKYCSDMGWPAEYVEAMTATAEDWSDIPDSIKKVASADGLDETAKGTIISAMVKEAKLTDEQASRIVQYWRDELGYQDGEWCKDLTAAPDA